MLFYILVCVGVLFITMLLYPLISMYKMLNPTYLLLISKAGTVGDSGLTVKEVEDLLKVQDVIPRWKINVFTEAVLDSLVEMDLARKIDEVVKDTIAATRAYLEQEVLPVTSSEFVERIAKGRKVQNLLIYTSEKGDHISDLPDAIREELGEVGEEFFYNAPTRYKPLRGGSRKRVIVRELVPNSIT